MVRFSFSITGFSPLTIIRVSAIFTTTKLNYSCLQYDRFVLTLMLMAVAALSYMSQYVIVVVHVTVRNCCRTCHST
jgi:hypothetical protein